MAFDFQKECPGYFKRTREEIVGSFYGQTDEDSRLDRTRHGQLEYRTTMSYIHRFAGKGSRVLEVGAGTGRYSIALAKEGMDVTAVELVESNLAGLREKGRGLENLRALQGDAADLSPLADDSFDVTLILGPMYHLYGKGGVDRAIDEAIRVTRPAGILMFAFLSVHAILYDNYLQPEPHTFKAGWEENFDKDMRVRHFPEQVFTGYDVAEFEALFENKPVAHLRTVATDGILELAEGRSDFSMTDEDFRLFSAYHLLHCEKRELLGSSAHLLYICRKRN